MHHQLVTYLINKLEIDEKDAETFANQFVLKKMNKGDSFLHTGDMCKKLAFINKGAMYCVYNKEGIDKIDEFSFEDDFITDYLSVLTHAPADKSIVCLEDCEILVVHFEALEKSELDRMAFERISRLMAEGLFIKWHLKAKSLFMDDAETRYKKLIAQRPDLPQRVPQYLVASFLNVSPETISRIRKKIAQK